MRARKLRIGRIRRAPALLAGALVTAGVAAVAPSLLSGQGGATGPGLTAQLERAQAVHRGPHADTPANRAHDRLLARLCAAPAYQRAHRSSCPAPAPSAANASRSQLASELAPADQVGRWAPPFSINTWAIHATLLPTGKVLWLSKRSEDNGGEAYLWDPSTGEETRVDPPKVTYPDGEVLPANLWCGAQVVLPDGRVLVVGGNLAYRTGDGPGQGWRGGRWVFTFDPWNDTWTRQPDMAKGRWYPTVTTLPDGRALIVGGWDDGGDYAGNEDVEVFTPSKDLDGVGTLTTVAQRTYPQLYPHMFVLPSTTRLGAGGTKVLMEGPVGRYPANSAILDTSTWRWEPVPPLPTTRDWGTATLLPGGPSGPDKILLAGGSDNPDNPSASPTSVVLDLNDPSATVTTGPSMASGRSHFNTVILPDETLISVGGGVGAGPPGDPGLYAGPIFSSEILRGGAWRAADVQRDARTYHSTALLLPDGRVLSAGDDRDTHIPLSARTAELYSPPYMFEGPRPQIGFAPGAARYGVDIHVTTPDPGSIAKAVLIRPGSTTHANDMDQRSMELAMTPDGAGGLTLRTPADGSIAPPGYYMLFLVDDHGVPSTASWIRLSADAPDAPAAPPPSAPRPPGTTPGTATPPPGAETPAPSTTRPERRTTRAENDGRAPVLSVGRVTLAVRGRSLIARVPVRADEAATAALRLRGPGSARASATVALRAGRRRVVTMRMRLPGGVERTRTRLNVRAWDAAGNLRTLARTVTAPVGRAAR
jgi:hypothetical protein